MFEQIIINTTAIKDEKYKFIFSVEAVNQLVLGGMSFRDAYQKVGEDITNNKFEFTGEIKHTHQGSINNLCNNEITKRFEKLREKF